VDREWVFQPTRENSMSFEKISNTEFRTRFIPQINYNHSDSDLTLYGFEADGEDLKYVKSKVADRVVWTAVYVDGVFSIVNGFVLTNRLYFFVCETPYDATATFEVYVPHEECPF